MFRLPNSSLDWIKEVNPKALVSVKVSGASDVDMVAVGSYYAGAHIVHLDGSYGGRQLEYWLENWREVLVLYKERLEDLLRKGELERMRIKGKDSEMKKLN